MALLAVPIDKNLRDVTKLNRKSFPFIQWIAIKPAGTPAIRGERVTDNG